MWIMGVMNKPYGLMINHDSLELPLQEGVWTWSTCLIQLLVSLSCLSSFPPFFPTQWPEEISLQKCTTYHICVVLMCIANFPKDDLWLDFFFLSCFLQHFSKCGQWTPGEILSGVCEVKIIFIMILILIILFLCAAICTNGAKPWWLKLLASQYDSRQWHQITLGIIVFSFFIKSYSLLIMLLQLSWFFILPEL